MKLINTRPAGEPGTKKILKKYPGAIRVRTYRDENGNRMQTVEIPVKTDKTEKSDKILS